MIFLAILKDSLKETLDSKIFYVLIVISVVLIVVCASIGYEHLPPERVLQNALKDVQRPGPRGLPGFPLFFAVEIADVHELDEAETCGLKAGYACTFILRGEEAESGFILNTYLFHRFFKDWTMEKAKGLSEYRYEAIREEDGSWKIEAVELDPRRHRQPWLVPQPVEPQEGQEVPEPAVVEEYPAPDAAAQAEFVESKLRHKGFSRAIVEPLASGDRELRFGIKAGFNQRGELHDVEKLSLLFGAGEFDVEGEFSAAFYVFQIEKTIGKWIAGMVGIVISIIMTGWIFPRMIKQGTLDLLITKPISKSMLVLYKFLGGSTFALLLTTLLIGGSWVALSARASWWSPGYLVYIPVITFVFLVVYSVSVLFGVMTRNTVVSIMVGLGAWAVMGFLSTGYKLIDEADRQGVGFSEGTMKGIRVAHMVVPKAGEILDLGEYYQWKTMDQRQAVDPFGDKAFKSIKVHDLIWSPLVLILLCLGLSTWIFVRRDY